MVSCDDINVSNSSLSTNNSDNRFIALCYWEDDDESEDCEASDAGDDHSIALNDNAGPSDGAVDGRKTAQVIGMKTST